MSYLLAKKDQISILAAWYSNPENQETLNNQLITNKYVVKTLIEESIYTLSKSYEYNEKNGDVNKNPNKETLFTAHFKIQYIDECMTFIEEKGRTLSEKLLPIEVATIARDYDQNINDFYNHTTGTNFYLNTEAEGLIRQIQQNALILTTNEICKQYQEKGKFQPLMSWNPNQLKKLENRIGIPKLEIVKNPTFHARLLIDKTSIADEGIGI